MYAISDVPLSHAPLAYMPDVCTCALSMLVGLMQSWGVVLACRHHGLYQQKYIGSEQCSNM